MPRRDVSVRLRHMLDHAREVITLAEGKHRTDLDHDRLLELAIVRLLEIIGEAAGQVPEEFREGQREIPWRQIIGMRNRLIHGYDEVDLDLLWAIVTMDLPSLVGELERLVL